MAGVLSQPTYTFGNYERDKGKDEFDCTQSWRAISSRGLASSGRYLLNASSLRPAHSSPISSPISPLPVSPTPRSHLLSVLPKPFMPASLSPYSMLSLVHSLPLASLSHPSFMQMSPSLALAQLARSTQVDPSSRTWSTTSLLLLGLYGKPSGT